MLDLVPSQQPAVTEQPSPSAATRLWWRTPASRWFGATPVGNGRLGGMVFGRVYKETFQINEETLWSRLADRPNPDSRAHLDELALFGMPNNQSAYQQLANVTLLFGGQHEEHVEDYRRELDMETGVVTVSYTCRGSRVRRDYFASAVDDVLVMHIEGIAAGELELGAHMHRKFDGRGDPDGTDMVLRGKCGARGTSFEARLRVAHDGGSIRTIGDHVELRGADSATVLISVASDFRHDDYAAAAQRTIDAAAALSYAELRERHVADHRAAFGLFRIELPGDPALDELPTDER